MSLKRPEIPSTQVLFPIVVCAVIILSCGIRLQNACADLQISGRLPDPALQVDVLDLDGDGREEIVTLVPSGLSVSPYRSPGTGDFFHIYPPGRPLSFSASARNGWMVLNSMIDGVGLNSSLLRFEGGRITLIQEGINLWLAFRKTCLGSKPCLIGQNFAPEILFGDRIYQMTAETGGISYQGAPEMRLPSGASILKTAWIDLDGDGVLELFTLTPGHTVHIVAEGSPPWVYQLPSGGSTSADQAFLPIAPWKDGIIFADPDAPDTLWTCRRVNGTYRIEHIEKGFDGRVSGLFSSNGTVFVSITRMNQKDESGETLLYSLGNLR
ncbi:MAG: hypothetical protein K6360_02560 [Deltaproteobacteria bacterium]